MSLSASSSRKSLYALQSSLPYFSLTASTAAVEVAGVDVADGDDLHVLDSS